MSSEYLMGIDLGTSAVKVLLTPFDGGETASSGAEASIEYPVSTPHPGWSEQDPGDWWRGVAAATKTAFAQSRVDPSRVVGVAVSGQMHGAVLLDAHGDVLRPCILWNDQRSAPQCDWMTATIGLQNLLSWVGNPALAGFTAPKLLWVREHEPEVFDRIATLLLPKDYINLQLTGEIATEYSDASGTLLFDVARRRWSDEMMQALELPTAILPPVFPSTTIIGTVSRSSADVTGLRAGTPVIAGGADNACAAVGAGVVTVGTALTSLGTSGTVLAPSQVPRVDPAGWLHTFCHAAPDTWYHMGVVLSAGASVRWFRDAVAPDYRDRAVEQGLDPYALLTQEAAIVPAGSDGLVFLPYLTGERTPHGDPFARGVFFGLSPSHTRGHMFRSVLEGVTCALADSLDLITALNPALSTMRITGGGANSELWHRILSDVFDMPTVRVHTAGGPAWGACVIAGVGVGALASMTEAEGLGATNDGFLQPDAATARSYRALHRRFDALYPALRAAFRDNDALER